MKNFFTTIRLLLLCFSLFLIGCSNEDIEKVEESVNTFQIDYGTDIIYPSELTTTVTPLTEPLQNGFFSASSGLVIDPITGAIDMKNSQAGKSYKVTFTSEDGQVVSQRTVVLSGINYESGIFSLADGSLTVDPTYNDDPEARLPIGEFDADEDLAINEETGTLNLSNTLLNGGLGDDDYESFRIEYELDDESGALSQYTTVEIYHFASIDDVPENLLIAVGYYAEGSRGGGDLTNDLNGPTVRGEDDDDSGGTIVIIDEEVPNSN